ncbi:MAG: 1,4-dihydroxy-2-naphthoate octaprenyltransferase [Candidatus Lernaella stagnicola]|nr:1,4-dihydroxy-2-naphthoate octaprenyltransferase [Candidatus Lernaella stagnicola]
MSFVRILRDFARQSRMLFLTCTVVPVAFGGAVAYSHTGRFDWPLFLLTLLGVSIAHVGVNLSNDFFDFASGADRHDEDRPYSGGGDAIVRDGVPPESVKRWFWICFAAALAIGIVILVWIPAGHLEVMAVMVLGFLGGYFYTAPPLRLAYRGLGELDIFVFLGPAPVIGTYAVQTGRITWEAIVLSLPIAGLIALLLWINQYTDFESDKLAGKNNLVVRLGKKKARWGYMLLNIFVYAAVVYAVVKAVVEPSFLIVLIALPLAWRSTRNAFEGYDDPQRVRAAQADALMMHLMAGLLCSAGVLIGTLI